MNAPDPSANRARKSRNLVFALALAAFVLLVFAVTVVRLGQGGAS